jgi:hypothetical protein
MGHEVEVGTEAHHYLLLGASVAEDRCFHHHEASVAGALDGCVGHYDHNRILDLHCCRLHVAMMAEARAVVEGTTQLGPTNRCHRCCVVEMAVRQQVQAQVMGRMDLKVTET